MDEYINRSEFMNRITSANSQDNFSRMTGREVYEKIVYLLHNYPAVTISPVRKGQWVETDKREIICSECGKPAHTYEDDDYDVVTVLTDYCPYCGVNMEADIDG